MSRRQRNATVTEAYRCKLPHTREWAYAPRLFIITHFLTIVCRAGDYLYSKKKLCIRNPALRRRRYVNPNLLFYANTARLCMRVSMSSASLCFFFLRKLLERCMPWNSDEQGGKPSFYYSSTGCIKNSSCAVVGSCSVIIKLRETSFFPIFFSRVTSLSPMSPLIYR